MFLFVSILVLLEVSLRPSSRIAFILSPWCFNPCFIGSISETRRKMHWRFKIVQVSILVLLEVSLRLLTMRLKETGLICFNPCFIGSISETTHPGVVVSHPGICFNPCFIGTLSKTRHQVHWNIMLIGFNPCFNGTLSKTPMPYINGNAIRGFQSLF